MSEDLFPVKDWFPETLSDEAACAVHGFLEEFTYRFEQAFYAQIRRYNHLEIRDPGKLLVGNGDDIEIPWDKIL